MAKQKCQEITVGQNISQTIYNNYEHRQISMMQQLEDILGIERRRKKPWISDATFALAEEKAEAKGERNRSDEGIEEGTTTNVT